MGVGSVIRSVCLVVLSLLLLASVKVVDEAMSCFVNIDNASKAIFRYRSEQGRLPTSLQEAGLAQLRCPVSKREYVYKRLSAGGYVVYCPGKYHAKQGCRENHPQIGPSGPEIR